MIKDNNINTTIEFPTEDLLNLFCGPQDENLRIFKNRLDLKLKRNASGLAISGTQSSVNLAEDLIQQLQRALTQNEHLTTKDYHKAIDILSENSKANIEEIFKQKIKLPKQKNISGNNGNKNLLFAKTEQQSKYIDAIQEHDLTFGIGPAGTGKTYIAMAMAISELLNKRVKKIILSRPAVEAGEKLGFLPGDLTEKVDPYLRPLYDALYDFVDYDKAHELIEKNIIEVAPLAFMRGRTLSNSFIILDEAQNTNVGQMKMFLTRIGENSQCVVTGDITQIDLPAHEKSGLKQALRILDGIPEIAIVNFTGKDVIRHKLVSKIVSAYDRDNEKQKD